MKLPQPIFKKNLPIISWIKIYAREYGVQYSEMAILCLSPKAKYHVPKPSVMQVVIPEGNNSAFYIDKTSWNELVESLNNKYTSHLKKLAGYEKEINNKQLKEIFLNYQEKLFAYSVFAWTSFILNNYIADKATRILDSYIKKHSQENLRQDLIDSLFKPEKLAAVLLLQKEIYERKGGIKSADFNKLFKKYRWLSCLDIHNKPWTREEFKKHLKSLGIVSKEKTKSFYNYIDDLNIRSDDLSYLKMAKRFVYIKDARDDFRRYGVFLASALFREIAKRIGIKREELSYLKSQEVIECLDGRISVPKKIIHSRKKGFVLYLNESNKLTCIHGDNISKILKSFNLFHNDENIKEIIGMVASKGKVTGNVVIIKGIKDLSKVKQGDILVAITTHPDYVSAMKKAGAIITDEGGITSHAAIVSREFGLPCIVGTKQATKLLKDGDRIFVDAIIGKIKKLNN